MFASTTAELETGENVVGLRITQDDGYPPAVLGELEIVFAKGEPLQLPIDASWLYATGDVAAGWDRTGFDVAAFRPCAG